MSRHLLRLCAVASFLLLSAAALLAHDLPLQNNMNAFVKVDGNQLHLVLRVPLDLLRSVSFPRNGDVYDLSSIGPASQQALEALGAGVEVWSGKTRLQPSSSAARLSLPSDRSFEDYDRALAHVSQPQETNTPIYFDQGFFDCEFVYPISSPSAVFSIRTFVAADLKNYVKLTVRYIAPGESRAMLITSESGLVPLNPAWYQAASSFVVLGVHHILSGIDHLLFLFCLIIPLRRLRALVAVITSFTVGHSITLLGSAYGLAPSGRWFPPFVEAAIAATIFYMAIENIVKPNLRYRWLLAAFFGLIHGFGFSYALQQDLQFSGRHLLASLVAFNFGIELGQLAVLLAMLAALYALMRGAMAGRMGIIVLSAIVAHTAWHWMIDRGLVFWNTPWPAFDAAALAILARWLTALLLAAGAAKLISDRLAKRSPVPVAAKPEVLQPALKKVGTYD